MPLATMPHQPTVQNAPANNAWLAQQVRDRAGARVNGRQSAHGGRCSCCGRKPRSNELCEVVLDPASNLVARIGIGRCHFSYFRSSLVSLLHAAQQGTHPQRAQRMHRLQQAIAALPRNL